jgi:hypothetical protein
MLYQEVEFFEGDLGYLGYEKVLEFRNFRRS